MGKRNGRRRNKRSDSDDEVDDIAMHETLNRAGLRVSSVESDGNCLFRAFASQFCGDEEKHHEFRDECCDYIENEDPDFFSSFLDDENLSEYLNEMRKSGTWGTQLEIVALCRRYHVDCVIFRPDGLHYRIECEKPDDEEVRTLMLSHHGEEHFNEVRFKEKGRVLTSFDELELLLASPADRPSRRSARKLAPQLSRIVDL